MYEKALLAVGRAVVTRAAGIWLADRTAARRRSAPLAELVRRQVGDVFTARGLERQLEAIVDEVAQRLAPLVAHEHRGLEDGDRAAALDAAARVLTGADLSDAGLFAADADPAALAARLRAGAGPVLRGAGLSEPAADLFDRVLADAAACLLAIVVDLPPFPARAAAETLRRLSTVEAQLREVLVRLPRPTVDAPAGTGQDEDFRRRYLRQLSTELDVLEMPGLTTRLYRPRTTLTVAYLSLTVTARDRRQRRDRMHRAPDLWERAAEPRGREDTIRVEDALAGSSRMLLRGAPGCGKTTLLQWLAVTAARGAFQGELAPWNGLVPFLVRLRDYADEPLPTPAQLVQAPMIAELMPPAWVHRVLSSGRALLLVDGVDEVAEQHRPKVRRWLRLLLSEYPSVRVAVTSRPAAAGRDWLADLGFTPATVESMSPQDVRAFVARWHAAAADATPDALPCGPAELIQHEHRLLAQLDNEPHLRTLATNPLLCAMLCALNLDRNSQLPRNRLGLYDAALDMMLERRDAERSIDVDHIALDARAKTTLLRALALWLSTEGRTEVRTDQAVAILDEALRSIPAVSADPTNVLRHLLTRSGVIREPVQGRIDFVHRTFQEYLTAQEIADRGMTHTLAKRAHLDQWRETIIMAAGHGNSTFRTELLDTMDERARHEPRHTRQLRLLAVACLEVMPSIDTARQQRTLDDLANLLPPRRVGEARSLAAAGPLVLSQLPTTLEDLSPAAAAATVRTAALLPGALDRLARYGLDSRGPVQRELIRAWDYFDPEEYAQRVLADTPFDHGYLQLESRGVLASVRHLKNVRHVGLELQDDQVANLDWLQGAPRLQGLGLGCSALSDLAGLTDQPDLKRFHVYRGKCGLADVAALHELYVLSLYDLVGTDWNVLCQLPNLVDLTLHGSNPASLDVLTRLANVSSLSLDPAPELHLATAVQKWPGLGSLRLHDAPWIDDLAPITTLPLYDLTLTGTAVSDLSPLAQLPHVGLLDLTKSTACDIAPLAGMPKLWHVVLDRSPVSDLTPLAGLRRLETVSVEDCVEVHDISPLARLPRLKIVWLQGTAPGLDLAPLARRRLTIHLYVGQEVRGLDVLGRRAVVEWHERPG